MNKEIQYWSNKLTDCKTGDWPKILPYKNCTKKYTQLVLVYM